MSKQRKAKKIRPRTMSMRVEYFQGELGWGADHALALTVNGTHNGRIVKAKLRIELGNVQQLAGQLHNFVASEQRKVTIARDALVGANGKQATDQAKP